MKVITRATAASILFSPNYPSCRAYPEFFGRKKLRSASQYSLKTLISGTATRERIRPFGHHVSRFATVGTAGEEETRAFSIKDNIMLILHHYPSVKSTQDEVKKKLQQKPVSMNDSDPSPVIAIFASSQLEGRGTRGRQWISHSGNMFLTIAVPSDSVPVPITLLPLKIGVVVAERISRIVQSKVTVKWPNDVLVDDEKICGVLIESARDSNGECYFLIGIGVNVVHAPRVDTIGPHRGRKATCIKDHCSRDQCTTTEDGVALSKELAADISNDVAIWVSDDSALNKSDASNRVLDEWSSWFEFGKRLMVRDDPGNEIVVPLSIETDGRLRVRGQDGNERLLCTDYLL